MFNSRDEAAERYARAVGRIVFGVVLLVGLAVLVQRMVTMSEPAAAKIIAATWIVAAFCGWAVRQVTAPFAERAHHVSEIFTLSYAVPTLGVALILPLSLHLPVALAIGHAGDFDLWVLLSAAFAGPAHIAFATFATMRAVQLAKGRTAISPRAVYKRTLIIGALPFNLSVLIVGFTGLFIMPLLERMQPMIERERGTQAPLPMAIVV